MIYPDGDCFPPEHAFQGSCISLCESFNIQARNDRCEYGCSNLKYILTCVYVGFKNRHKVPYEQFSQYKTKIPKVQ